MTNPAPPFLTAEWRALAMLNYEVDPALLRDRTPAGTTLDDWQGKTFVSVVGFRFLGTRLLGLPVPFHRNFDEVNLRFYVRRDSEGELRRGVVFVKEIAPRAAVTWVARRCYHENYVTLPMRHDIRLPRAASVPGVEAAADGDGSARYEWRLGDRWCGISVDVEGRAKLPADDSEETFITEHYWGYVSQPDGSTLEYRVEHPRWRVWQGRSPKLTGDVTELYGRELAGAIAGTPSSAFVADGSPVTVRKGVRLA